MAGVTNSWIAYSPSMAAVRLEILVEPFVEDAPGPHVAAAVETFERAGLVVEMGPFSTIVDGDLDAVVDALASALKSSFAHGADQVRISLERGPGEVHKT